MAADLELLKPQFKLMAKKLVLACEQSGVDMRANTGLRDPFEQGRLWRQSKSIEEIRAKIEFLNKQQAPFLAFCIESVGPQNGKPVTNAVPGLSWHQWGEALDFFWMVDGAANWSTTKLINGKNGYKELAIEAEKLGLDAGGHWPKFKDWPHVQWSKNSSPLKTMSYAAIDVQMKKQYG